MSDIASQTYTRADEAFDCLQTAIVKGDLAPGDKIGELCAYIGEVQIQSNS